MNSLQQQTSFDGFINEFNTERPHKALDMKCPGEVYTLSIRPTTACQKWNTPVIPPFLGADIGRTV